MDFALTTAGRAAIADGANVGLNQITLTHLAIGDGQGQVGITDAARTTLRNERLRSALVGSGGSVGAARVGVRASFTGAPGSSTWNVTEAGIVARIGAAGAEFLFAYGAVAGGADPLATIGAGVSTTIAADLRIVASAADVAVTVAPSISVAGATAFTELTDTPGALLAGRYYRADATGSALEAVTPAVLAAQLAPLMVTRWTLPAGFVAVQNPGQPFSTQARLQVRGTLTAPATIATVTLRAAQSVDGWIELAGQVRAWWELVATGGRLGVALDGSSSTSRHVDRHFSFSAPGNIRLRAAAISNDGGHIHGGAGRTYLLALAG